MNDTLFLDHRGRATCFSYGLRYCSRWCAISTLAIFLPLDPAQELAKKQAEEAQKGEEEERRRRENLNTDGCLCSGGGGRMMAKPPRGRPRFSERLRTAATSRDFAAAISLFCASQKAVSPDTSALRFRGRDFAGRRRAAGAAGAR